jgi:hypothetical protein
MIAAPTALLCGEDQNHDAQAKFQTSDRCIACHDGLKTPSGKDISIGFDWRSSMMANSSRDPYWQASVRRESIDHPQAKAVIENECSVCHMPISYREAKAKGRSSEVFSHLPFDNTDESKAGAEDGVSCSVCHQISKMKLGTPESFNGRFVVDAPEGGQRSEYGPFSIDKGHQRVMQSSTGGFTPVEATHIRDSAVCATCHTLHTKSIGPNGEEGATFPEQVPYQEYLHSSYPANNTCQSCHMPEVKEPVAITVLFGQPRQGMHRHEFVAANFFMQNMFNLHRDDLSVAALPEELTAASEHTVSYLQSRAARLSIHDVQMNGDGLSWKVLVENLGGHKLPTAYPSRRVWLHVTVRDRDGKAVFESGALNPDGSIVGNDNDIDPKKFEPHYREITKPDQVEIYESILKDAQGQVTTGLLSAVTYYKDNRLLPTGFDKATAEKDIAVIGEAAEDPDFTDKGSAVRYSVPTGGASGPFSLEVELMYQPIGFRWAHNLEPYHAASEPKRFVDYFSGMASSSAVQLTKAEAKLP